MKKILIAGFGDTGVLAAIYLPKCYEITAISTKPVLLSGQELGVRITDQSRWQEDYKIAFSRYKHLEHVNIVQGKVLSVNTDLNTADVDCFKEGLKTFHYDVLLIASGVRNGFWREPLVESLHEINVSLQNKEQTFKSAKHVCVIGGGPTAVSAAFNLKKCYPQKSVNLYFPHESVLQQYPVKTQNTISTMLQNVGVELHASYRAVIDKNQLSLQENKTIKWHSGQPSMQAELALFAVGNLVPNSDYLPADMLNENGFVKANKFLRVPGFNNVFVVGDIADTDANHSSARNEGYKIVANNIDCFLQGKEQKMKTFKAPKYRWGSILGVQLDEGLRVFTPSGANVRVSLWWVKKLLFPFFVREMIYRGVRKAIN